MARELEILGLASVGGWLKKRAKHLLPVGTPCPNCETPLAGPYCYTCGQLGEQFERSVWHLLVETVEGLFHFDGRLFQTLPKLTIKPGELTRSYLAGKRAYQIPPLRMFLVVLLVVFFVGGVALNNEVASGKGPGGGVVNFKTQLTPAQRAKLNLADSKTRDAVNLALAKAQVKSAIKGKSVHVPGADLDIDDDDDAVPAPKAAAPPKAPGTAAQTTAAQPAIQTAAPAAGKPAVKAKADDQNVNIGFPGVGMDSRNNSQFKANLKKALDNKEAFLLVLEDKAHNYAFLMLPLSALLLTILYVFQRRFYVFDHLIFSMHSLSFQGLLLSVVMLTGSWGLPSGWLMWASPVHLFFHMRGAYGSSIFGTLLRMFLLFLGTFFGVVFLVMGLMMDSIATMGGH